MDRKSLIAVKYVNIVDRVRQPRRVPVAIPVIRRIK